MRRPNGPRKNREVRFKASRVDVARLQALAKLFEITPSAVMRRLIAEESARHDTTREERKQP